MWDGCGPVRETGLQPVGKTPKRGFANGLRKARYEAGFPFFKKFTP